MTVSEMQRVVAPDGASLLHEVVGAGEPVVFVHGGFTSHHCWKPQRAELSGQFRLVLRDLRGHDGSLSVTPDPYTFETTEMADMLAVLDAEGIERAHIVGHSTGGAIAFLFALHHPERVRRLVLIEPTLSTLLPPEVIATQFAVQMRALERVEQDGPAAYIDTVLAELCGPDWRSRLSPRSVAAIEAQSGIAIAHARAFGALSIGDDELRALSMPALLLYGDRSMAWEALIRERIGQVRPDLERRTIAGAGHNLHLEQPQQVNAAIRSFLGASAPA